MDKNVKLAAIIAVLVIALGAGVMAMMRGGAPASGGAPTAEGQVTAEEKSLVDREATGTPAPGAPTGTTQ
jgi:hypothetical protein